MSEFGLADYIRMQNEIYMSGRDSGPNVEVTVYGDDKTKKILHVWYDAIDQPIIDSYKSDLFVKAYTQHGRDGVNTQTSHKIDFSDLGYGPNSTAALRRLIALSANGWTLQFLRDQTLEVFPKNDNHLDLRRDNLVIGRVIYHWGEERREEYSLTQAKYLLERER